MIGAGERSRIAGASAMDDEATRVRLAASAATPPALLRRLATDRAALVRAAVAMNPAAAPDLDRLLTADDDERVRALLADKVARLLPGLCDSDRSAATAHVRATLAVLVSDEAVRVRVAIAEAVKAMPEAPRELILRLARDHAPVVSDPVIRLSPLLTDQDLLALLATPPHPHAALSVAGRPGLSAAVADAVVAHADEPAMRALLANHSAALRESTLDGLVGRAGDHAAWHEALVRRPSLSPTATRALAAIVSAQFLAVLAQRADLDPGVAAALQARMHALDTAAGPPGAARSDESLLASLRPLTDPDAASERAMLDAAHSGDLRRVAAILAVASGVALAAVDRAAALRSAKALVSLAWRAGFSMAAARMLQLQLGQLGRGTMLAAGRDGGFPLSAEEMEWQIDRLTEAAE